MYVLQVNIIINIVAVFGLVVRTIKYLFDKLTL